MRGNRGKPKSSSRSSNESGQASILVGAMILTFSLFFAFVVNTGMLVHAKINLQNAADAAAYAGAAVQARQLTDISFLNYEMRRQWKKFLFRYYVLGTFGQETHPRQPTGTRNWAPRASEPPLGVPTICVNVDARDNHCQNRRIPGIPMPAGINGSDAITSALARQLERFELLRQGGCISIGVVNTLLRDLWLFNTDPTLENVLRELEATANANNTAMIQNAVRTVRSMASGLGIIPRLMLLRKRIDTLQKYVNHRPHRAMNLDEANRLKEQSGVAGPDWASLERPIQSYFSAYHALGNHTFSNPEEIVLEEMIPPGANDQANLLALQDIKTSFGMYSVDMAIGGCGAGANQTIPPSSNSDGSRTACFQCLTPINFSSNTNFQPTVGVAKDPSILTYYAVKLSAKAKVLFSPFGDVTLTAYSAAQPFGSRIGPPAGEVFFSQAARPTDRAKCFGTACPDRIPNLPIQEGEPNEPTQSTGWNQNLAIYHFFQRLAPQGTGGTAGTVPPTITLRDMLRAYQVAMVPNPWEIGKYNIPNDLTGGDTVPLFSQRGIHAIWAPIIAPGSSASSTDLRDQIAEMIDAIRPADTTSQSAFPAQLQRALVNGIDNYINRFMVNGQGDDGEGVNVVRLFNPFMTREVDANGNPASPQAIQGLPENLMVSGSDPARVQTSWSDVPDATLRTRGRTGYSVKFVPLRQLASGSGVTTDGSTPFVNRLPASESTTADLQVLKH